MQGSMPQGAGGQGPVPLTPHGIELSKSTAAAGYFADRLRTDERQRSYMTLQQVGQLLSSCLHLLQAPGDMLLCRSVFPHEAICWGSEEVHFCMQMNPGEAEWGLPETVQQYHSLYPLEDIAAARDQPSQAFGIPSIALKAVSSRDGQPYTLRRLDSRQA